MLLGGSGLKKITVFGATGGTGKQVVEQALASGERGRCRTSATLSKLGITRERLSIVQGELSDAASIERAVTGADAVISALGPRGGSKKQTAHSRDCKT